MTYLLSLFNDEEGQDLVEYALLLGFIALLAIAAVGSIGTKVNGYYSSMKVKLT